MELNLPQGSRKKTTSYERYAIAGIFRQSAEEERLWQSGERPMQALIVATVLGPVAGIITADHFKGPIFHDVVYCLNDGGAQKTRMCTGRVPP
jgi:hypothetical protein